MKFLADEMCGDINRWLRMLGYDSTTPQNHPKSDGTTPNDDEIIDICLSTYRILISKDVEIIKKMREKIEKYINLDEKFISYFDIKQSRESLIYPCLLLRLTEITVNLSEIKKKFNIQLDYDIAKTRCPKCNALLKKVNNREDFKDRIPPNVYDYHTQFWECSNSECGQLFWKGTHLERIIQTLKSIQKKD